MTFRTIVAGAAAFLMTSTSAFALTITATDDAETLANTILGSGVTLTSATYTGAAQASGTFTDGDDTGIGISSGLILTTGNATDAIGPNSDDSLTVNNGEAGFTSNGFDASILEIKFTTQTGDLFFDYVFASEEYNEFANSTFNDQFQFLLSGPGFAGDENIALIPGTSTPVSINTVNGGDPFGTGAVNEEFFNNNDLDDGGPFFNIEYDGFTDVFTAEALGLMIDQEYTITLFVEDISDNSLDSAVFVKAGSFSGVDPVDPMSPVPVPASLPLLLAGLGGLHFLRRKKQKA